MDIVTLNVIDLDFTDENFRTLIITIILHKLMHHTVCD